MKIEENLICFNDVECKKKTKKKKRDEKENESIALLGSVT